MVEITNKTKLAIAATCALIGLIMTIVGGAKIHDCGTSRPLIPLAAELENAAKNNPKFELYTIAILDGSDRRGFVPIFGHHTFLQQDGSPAYTVGFAYQNSKVNINNTHFPLKIQIIYHSYNHDLELPGSFEKNIEKNMVCAKAACTQAEMDLQCQSEYVHTKQDPYTALSGGNCIKGQVCGICSVLVRRLSGCWALAPPAADEGKADWTYDNNTACPPEVADVWNSGKKADLPNLPSYVNVSVFNTKDPFVSISDMLVQHGRKDGTFPNWFYDCPHHGSGTATVVFGVLFLLIGVVGSVYYAKAMRDDAYNAVPDSWRSVN